MKNKFINLFLQEPSLDSKIVVVFFFIILSLTLQKDTRLKDIEVLKLRQDKITAQNLEKQIPALENKLKGLEETKGKAVSIIKRKIDFVLKGILTKDGKSEAIIGDDIYQENDVISGFIITSITSNTVTIQDPSTGEQGKIQLPE